MTATSTITSPSSKTAELDDVKNDILAQMKALNDKSDARVDRIEKASQDYEKILQAMMVHNQKNQTNLRSTKTGLLKLVK